jgi:hypothetical protein
MITVFDSSNYAQQVFLKEAYATLAAQGNILNPDEIAAGKFLSLDGYFAHMEHLVKLEPKFAMIPTDENPFEINANTRTIAVPASFSKCAGVVGDNMCEIITFTIDRYFDYVDLANARICVQWKLPAKPGEEAEEGISHIGLKDLNTVSGKIRFGWPLTDALTKAAGNVTFSVRFFMENTVTDADGKTKSQLVYLFNTLPATLPIKEGLNVSGDDVVVEQGVADLFKEFVVNSNNPSYAMPQPVTYVKNLPLDSQKVDDETDTLVLRAQATTTGDGYIKYKWYLKVDEHDKTNMEAVPMLITNDHKNFDIDDNVFVSVGTDWSKLAKEKHKQYYISNGSLEAKDMVRVELKVENGAIKFYTYEGVAVPANTEVYERYTQLTIVPSDGSEESKKITGLYHVGAYNVVGDDVIEVTNTVTTADGQTVDLKYTIPGINATPEQKSNECYVPVPAPVIIEDKNNLERDTFIDPVNKAILSVVPNKDSGNPRRVYSWYRLDEDKEVELDAEGNWIASAEATPVEMPVDNEAEKIDRMNLITDVAGWYYVDIESKLNRDTRDAQSKITRVVNLPQKPELVKAEYAPWGGTIKPDELSWNSIYENGEIKDADGYNTAKKGDCATLRVNIQDLSSKLLSDEVTYEWYVIAPDDKAGSEGTKITASMFGPNSIVHEDNEVDTNVLNVRCDMDVNNIASAHAYYCKITNTLAGKTSELNHKDYVENIKVMFFIH